jgi:3-phenylpropionate/trans-cinnamate dioxygenase ferredoxin reductase subunit
MTETTSIVVVGGGVAAASFVSSYREAGGQELITVLSAEKDPPYNRPPLSKGVLREEMEPRDALVQDAQAYEEQVIDLRLEAPVTAIDVEAREVVTADERIPYGTLVVATGARPRPFPVDGADDLFGVHTFRTMADAIDVRDARDAHSVLVAGASFIGVEVAASLRALGRNVTLVDPMGTVMPKLLCDELSTQLADLLEAKGIELVLGEEIAELRANGRLLIGATTSEGRSIEAFLGIAGVGVVPNVELPADAGAEVDDGVVVDERFRTSLPDVFAIGDVAAFPEPISGERKRVEHWSTATAQGSYLGRFLAAGAEDGFEPYDEVPVFFTQVFDLKIQMLGAPREVDECSLVGSVEEGKLFGVHLKDGVPVGAVLAGHNQDVAAAVEHLLRDRKRIDDPSVLQPDPRVLLAAV